MLLYPMGILIAIISLGAAIIHLHQDWHSFYDLVALLVVFGGTLAVSVVVLPWRYHRDIRANVAFLFGRKNADERATISKCISFFKSASERTYRSGAGGHLYENILNDGYELIVLGLKDEKIEAILNERVVQHSKRQRKIANSIRGLSKYPPAFGLMGTVLGLVTVMQGVSEGADGKATAFKMALALVSTMYGLVTANIIINPAGELILKKAGEDESMAELAITTVLLAAQRVSLLEAQETLNSYVSDHERINVISGYEEAA